jgi:hypothetical protein
MKETSDWTCGDPYTREKEEEKRKNKYKLDTTTLKSRRVFAFRGVFDGWHQLRQQVADIREYG